METLPPEVMLLIGQYLPAKDLASCCAVSVWWREVFGSNIVWRRRCDEDAEEHLRTTPCRVEPKFTSPEAKNSTLSPIGRWRTAYMREKHLWNNWTHGIFVTDEISNPCRQVVFINNDFVITVTSELIRLMDTTVKPAVCVAKFVERCSTCEVSVVRSDTFIIWNKKNTVRVVCVDWKSYALSVKLTFSVTEGSISNYDIVNTVFLGFDKNILHVWDIESATELKTESCLVGFRSVTVGHDDKCENVGAIYMKEDGEGVVSYFCLYDVKGLKFWPFSKLSHTRLHSFAIVENYVALTICREIKVFNYRTSQCLHSFRMNRSMICTVGNSFMFIKANRELVQISPETGFLTSLHSNISGYWRVVKKLYTVFIINSPENRIETWKICSNSEVKPMMFASMHANNTVVNQAYSKVGVLEKNELFGNRAVLRSYW